MGSIHSPRICSTRSQINPAHGALGGGKGGAKPQHIDEKGRSFVVTNSRPMIPPLPRERAGVRESLSYGNILSGSCGGRIVRMRMSGGSRKTSGRAHCTASSYPNPTHALAFTISIINTCQIYQLQFLHSFIVPAFLVAIWSHWILTGPFNGATPLDRSSYNN